MARVGRTKTAPSMTAPVQRWPTTGHDYRLKNFFGWDLRGAEGLYGADYQNKSYVLPVNLLTDGRDQAALVEWFTKGGEGLPAMGEVLSPAQITAMAAFVIATREGELPQPDQIFALSKDAPKNYVLNEGGDAAKGAAMFGSQCAGCHGDKGDGFLDRRQVHRRRLRTYQGLRGLVQGRQRTSRQPHVASEHRRAGDSRPLRRAV